MPGKMNFSSRNLAEICFEASLKGEPILRQFLAGKPKKICGHLACIPRTEAAGPQGQAGSARFKFHYSSGEVLF